MDLPSRLSYLFGTEEYVLMRRKLVLLREMLFYHQYKEEGFVICSGSLGEGVAYPTFDDNLMMCYTALRVVKSCREATQLLDLLMVPSESSPGYCLLLDITGFYHENLVFIIYEMPFLSSLLWKHIFLLEGQFIHGPCQSGNLGELEFHHARCVYCSFWPEVASDWVHRDRLYDWPSHEMIQNIVRGGCHVVPIGDPDSPFSRHEWRISFSVAERTLMHSFNHAQFLIYSLLRLTQKRIIEKEVPNVFCSHFMKTALFYIAENTSVRFWQVSNLETCIKACFSVLYDYVDHIYFPNYFIPECNLIKRKVNHTNQHQVLDLIRNLHTIGIVGLIHLSGESGCMSESLSLRIMELELDREFMFSYHLQGTLKNIENILNILPHETIKTCTFSLSKFVHLLQGNVSVMQSKFIKIILHKGIMYCCHQMMDRLWIVASDNRQNYSLYKTVESLLRLGYNGDVTTGKLTTATYMYLVGKTKSALSFIRQLLSEYPPYVMDILPNYLKNTTYIDLLCSRGYTIDHKTRCASAPLYQLFSVFLNAFPLPLRIWISTSDFVPLHPLSYAFFLESLCHIRLQNRLLVMKSTRSLTNHIDDLVGDFDIMNTKMCVGIIKYVQGDNQSACRWLGSVYILKDAISPFNSETLSRSALTYISCMLNKQFHSESGI